MTPIAEQVSITAIIPMLTAIGNRQWEQFKELEADFVSQYGVEVWQGVGCAIRSLEMSRNTQG
ncbi:MAG: hypothetical protein RMY28_025110 [Nostoc sp. ChiSLP01]|nr:hypothetical protein [Nostoc sp. CmiSLP01]MDZ8286659.1 hypothetical protein [Nostoc sp. ChiSLP01]